MGLYGKAPYGLLRKDPLRETPPLKVLTSPFTEKDDDRAWEGRAFAGRALREGFLQEGALTGRDLTGALWGRALTGKAGRNPPELVTGSLREGSLLKLIPLRESCPYGKEPYGGLPPFKRPGALTGTLRAFTGGGAPYGKVQAGPLREGSVPYGEEPLRERKVLKRSLTGKLVTSRASTLTGRLLTGRGPLRGHQSWGGISACVS